MTTVPLKHLARINERTLPEITPPDTQLKYLDIGSVGRGRLLEEPELVTFGEAPSRARRVVRPGDTIISTVRTYLGAVWPVEGPQSGLVVSTGFAVLTPGSDLEPRYLGWLAQSDLVVEEIVARSVGVSYPAINALEIGDLRVPWRGLDQQRAIADFLDVEISRIDALVAKKRQLSKAVGQRWWVTFAAGVQSVEAPTVPFRRALRSITDGPFGSAFSSDEYSADGVAVVRLGNIGFAEWRNSDLAHLPARRLEEFTRYRVRAGDLLIAGLGDLNNHAGRACVAPDLGPAIVKGKCFCAQVDRYRASPDYLALFCSSPSGAEAVRVAARGSTRSMINLDIIKALPIPLPSVALQHRIVEVTENARRAVKAVTRLVARQIDLLQEHRQALITAAVTGELEIPGVAA